MLWEVLTNVVEDRARVDEEQFIALALNVIEAPRLRMLDHLERTIAVTGNRVSQFSLGCPVRLGTVSTR